MGNFVNCKLTAVAFTTLIGISLILCHSLVAGYGCVQTESVTSYVCVTKACDTHSTLLSLPRDVRRVTVAIDNKLSGKFYSNLGTDAIDISNIQVFKNLRHFALVPLESGFFQQYPLDFNVTTFREMPIENFTINLPVAMRHSTKMSWFGDLKTLRNLDLSNSNGVSLNTVNSMLRAIRANPVRNLLLSGVQKTGTSNFQVHWYPNKVLTGGENFPQVEHLNLSHNALGVLHPGISTLFPNLKVLDVSFNMLTGSINVQALIELLMLPNIVDLHMNNQGCLTSADSTDTESQQLPVSESQPSNHIQDISRFPISRSLSANHVPHTNGFGSAAFLSMLKCINSFCGGNLTRVFKNSSIVCAVLTCFDGYLFRDIPCSLWKPLEAWYDHRSLFLVQLPIAKNLERLDFSDEALDNKGYSYAYKGKIRFSQSKLTTFKFSNNKKWFKGFNIASTLQESWLSGFDNLQYVDISNGNIKISSPLPFLHMQSLQNISLSGNKIYLSRNESYLEMCGWDRAYNLKAIDLSNSEISYLPHHIFSNCSSLISISLARNRIEHFSIDLEDLQSLLWLDISSNLIKRLDQPTQWQLKTHPSLTVNFINNPLSCDCHQNSGQFLKWFLSTEVIFHKQSEYVCYSKLGTMFLKNLNYDNYITRCFPSDIRIISVTVAITLAIIAVVISLVFLYTRRWRLRYLLFKWQQRTRSTSSETIQQSCRYDAFVSYCAEDRFWTHATLVKELENCYGFQLCIHYRDFPVGEVIADVIVEAIENSREVILVLSDWFIQSEWCQFEFNVAHRMLLSRGKPFIIIKMSDLSKVNDMPSLAYLLDTQNILQWPENEDGQKLFWAKLVSAMYDTRNQDSTNCFEPLCFRATGTSYIEIQGLADSNN